VPCAWRQHILRRSWVDKDLEQICIYRQQIIERLFGDKDGQTSVRSC
jgi:hypothetical protein